MAQKWELTVHQWLNLKVGIVYPMRVLHIERARGNKDIEITLQHLNKKQAGRKCRTLLPLPVRGEGHPTTEFFAACGMPVNENDRISPSDAVGRTIGVIFAPGPGNGESEPAIFTQLREETHNDERSESQS